MQDFNFFHPYVEKKEHKNIKAYSFYTVMGVLLLIGIAYPIINHVKINQMISNVEKIKEQAMSPSVQGKIEQVEGRKQQLEDLQEKLQEFSSVDQRFKQSDRIHVELIEAISLALPEEVFFKTMNIGTDGVTLDGVAKDRMAIGQFQYNIRNGDYFEDVFVPNIMRDGSYYNFSMTFKIKGVTYDETN